MQARLYFAAAKRRSGFAFPVAYHLNQAVGALTLHTGVRSRSKITEGE